VTQRTIKSKSNQLGAHSHGYP